MVFNIEEVKQEYFRLRTLGMDIEKQAELGGIIYGYQMGLKDSLNTGSGK